MKKTLLAIGIVAALFSCKKDEEITPLEATDLTGTATLAGKITYTNPSGNEKYLAGATVTVMVKNAELYPNSTNAQGSKTFTGTSDANGNYSIAVTVHQEGSAVTVSYANVNVTGNDGDVYAYSSADWATTLHGGVKTNNNVLYTSSKITDASNVVVGTAIVRGQIKIRHYRQQSSGSTVFNLVDFILPNHEVKLTYDEDPSTFAERVYTTTTDADGNYSFTIDAADEKYNLDDDYEIMIVDYDATQDTIMSNGFVIDGRPGVFNERSGQGAINAGEIDNNAHLTYFIFTAD